jgi:hypothetical protein
MGKQEMYITFQSENLKRLFGISGFRWENNIKIDLKGIGVRIWTGFI